MRVRIVVIVAVCVALAFGCSTYTGKGARPVLKNTVTVTDVKSGVTTTTTTEHLGKPQILVKANFYGTDAKTEIIRASMGTKLDGVRVVRFGEENEMINQSDSLKALAASITEALKALSAALNAYVETLKKTTALSLFAIP